MSPSVSHILLIDDDTTTNFLHERLLRRQFPDAAIRITNSGNQALELLNEPNQTPPDLIFLDLNTPHMPGWNFLWHFHRQHASHPARVVVVTTTLNAEDLESLQAFPPTLAFSKPLTEQKVQQVLETYFSC